MQVVALLMLVMMDDPFPMWLTISGGGSAFISAGSALRRGAHR